MRKVLLVVACVLSAPAWGVGQIEALPLEPSEDPCAPDPTLQDGKTPVVVDEVACAFRSAWKKNNAPQPSVAPAPAPSPRALRKQKRAQRRGERRNAD